ncbi:N-substituted formamide deformylase precursor [Luteitalea pratensis]|uniref:N-substituted formamide deformylase n=1 Tax=Luteitalea pratensis TaxID=1855912 RepID=A0A143PJD9_LUTPR|nr:amidohydrolase [Luteitalea pratensis]AMY08621.1 N-substituted formamide deformylase precursor [Luteitalea pratensis]
MIQAARLALAVIAYVCLAMTVACTATQAQPRPAAADGPADLLVVHGKVVTVDARFTIAEAVAVRNGRIVDVGTDAHVRRLAGQATRVIDARGRTVIPGLIDSHVHAIGAAPVEAITPFRTLASISEVQAWLRDVARRTPAPSWVWSTRVYPTRLREGRFPTRLELDVAVPDRPAVVDGAYAFVLNTQALAAAGVTADTPDPPGAVIVRGPDGTPTGLLRNAGSMLARFRPAAPASLPLDQIERLHRAYLATGITSIVERGGSVGGFRTYEALKAAARLRIRSTITLMLPTGLRAEQAEAAVAAIDLAPRAGDDWLKVGPLKITVDGGILLGTSYMRTPYPASSRALYGDQPSSYRGVLSTSAEAIRAVMIAGHARGWQMSAHVTGDAGVDAVLDGFEAAQRAMPRADARHTLIHAYFPNPETARRVAALGVQVDTQPAWFYKDADALVGALGVPGLAHFIGLRTWRDAGVRVAINTDHMFGADRDSAMNPFNPFLTMATAVTRRTESGRVIGAGEAVTREGALRMMTIDAAAMTFDEGSRGSIEVGKLADLAILSEDLLTCPDDRIRAITADITIIGGVIAHQRH